MKINNLTSCRVLGYYKIMNKKQKQIIKEWRKISNKLIFIKNKNKEVDELFRAKRQ